MANWFTRNAARIQQPNWYQKQPWGVEERMDRLAEAALTMSTLIAEGKEDYFPSLTEAEFKDEMRRLFHEMCAGNFPDYGIPDTAYIQELVVLFHAEGWVVMDPGG